MGEGAENGWPGHLFGGFYASIEGVVGGLDCNPPTSEREWVSQKVFLALNVSHSHDIWAIERGWDGECQGEIGAKGIDGRGGDHLSLVSVVSFRTRSITYANVADGGTDRSVASIQFPSPLMVSGAQHDILPGGLTIR